VSFPLIPLIPANAGTQAGLGCKGANPASMAAPQALLFQHEEHEASQEREAFAILVLFVLKDGACGARYVRRQHALPHSCLDPGVRRDERRVGA
jgi:hypothetical protein